jgi:hypothetical protein
MKYAVEMGSVVMKLWHVYPLLGGDREIGDCTAARKQQKNGVFCAVRAKVTPQAMWPIAKSLLKRDRPRSPTAIHGLSSLKFLPSEKANVIADCMENQFTHH